jgi:hypothetical protein
MNEYQWLLNNGLAVAVIVFVGFLLWRVLVGSKASGYQGLLIRWANGLSQDIKKHSAEATSEFAKGRTERTKAAMKAVTLMCRLVARKLPDLEADIDRHCAEIERIIGDV